MAFRKAFDEVFLKGAIRTVAAVGIENTRTKDIAECAGFSEATLFRRFATKEALLQSAFLAVDREVSELFTRSDLFDGSCTDFEENIFRIWCRIYQFLIDNRDKTLFLLRYRYSSLYTEEVRMQRQAYNGSFEKAYTAFEKHYGLSRHSYREFLINYIFELTLCFTEKIITGRIENTPAVQQGAWETIHAVICAMTQADRA